MRSRQCPTGVSQISKTHTQLQARAMIDISSAFTIAMVIAKTKQHLLGTYAQAGNVKNCIFHQNVQKLLHLSGITRHFSNTLKLFISSQKLKKISKMTQITE